MEIIHDTKEKAIERLYSMLDQNNIDYLPLDKQKILDKLTDIDYYIANLVDSRSMYKLKTGSLLEFIKHEVGENNALVSG